MTRHLKKGKTYEDYLKEAGHATGKERQEKNARLYSGIQYKRNKKK